MKHFKRHIFTLLLVAMIFLILYYLPQILVNYHVPYLSSQVETKDINDNLLLHYSFNKEKNILTEHEKRALLFKQIDQKFNQNGLILHLPFEENSLKFQDKTSTVNKYGTPKTSDGKEGKSLNLYRGDAVSFERKNRLKPNTFTVGAWVYPTDTTGNDEYIIANALLGDKKGFHLSRNNGQAVFWAGNGSMEKKLRGGKLPEKEWHHIAATLFKTGKIVLYVDGKKLDSANLKSQIIHPDRNYVIGDNTWSPGDGARQFIGKIDEIKVYNRPIEITQPAPVTIPDESCPSSQGIIRGDPEWVEGKHGKALSFDGDGDQIVVKPSSSFRLSQSVTFSFWIYPKENQTLHLLGNLDSYYFWNRNGYTHFTLRSGGEKFAQPKVKVPKRKWTHILGTYKKGGKVRLYKNGDLKEAVGPFYKTIDRNQKGLKIAMGTWADKWFDGYLDEIKLWNNAINENQASAIFFGKNTTYHVSKDFEVTFILALLFIIIIFSYLEQKYTEEAPYHGIS